MQPKTLTAAQIDHFIRRGYLAIPDCFSRNAAKERVDRAWVRLGYDPRDRSTWKQTRLHMGLDRQDDFETYAPKAFAAAADLVGGIERIKRPAMFFSEGFIINLNDGADRPWDPPSARVKGWHKDGNWFHHFLDSPEQALLMIFVYSDIRPRGGGTFIANDSVGVVARFLAQHPEGISPGGFDFPRMASECTQFEEMTGNVGDIILMHPYMLHTISQNHSDVVRFIINPALSLAEPMNFNRENVADFSPVEQAILNGLGVARYDFHPTTERRRVVSDQEKMQEKLIAEEKAKLAAKS